MRRPPRTESTNTNNRKTKEKNEMKKKARTALIVAGLIAAMLLAGKIDNDTAEQKNAPRTTCNQITTPDGAGACR